jgi:hypothetical protein
MMNNQAFAKSGRPVKIASFSMVLLIVVVSLPVSLLGNIVNSLYPKEWSESKYFNNKVFITLSPAMLKSYFPSEFQTKVIYSISAAGSSTAAELAGEKSESSFGKGISIGYSIVAETFVFFNVEFEYLQCSYPDNMVTDNRTVMFVKLPPDQTETIESISTYQHSGKKLNMYGICFDMGLMLPYVYTVLPVSLHFNVGISLYDVKFHSDYSDSLIGLPDVEYRIGRLYKQQGSEWSDSLPIVISLGTGVKFYFLKNFAIALDYRGFINTFSKTQDVGGGAYIVNTGIETGCVGSRLSGGLSFYF